MLRENLQQRSCTARKTRWKAEEMCMDNCTNQTKLDSWKHAEELRIQHMQ